MRLLCVSAQLPGHLDWGGYVNTAVALQARGHDVLWATGQAAVPLLQRHGLPVHVLTETGWRWPPPPPFRPQPGEEEAAIQRRRQRRSFDQWLDVDRVTAAAHELLAAAEQFQPDAIIAEMFMASAGLVAERLDVPLVVAGWPAPPLRIAGKPVLFDARARLEKLLDAFSLSGCNWTEAGPPALRSSHLHVTYWNDDWYGAPSLLPTVHVGGRASLVGDTTPPMSDGFDSSVLITLGTSFNDDPDFFVAAAHASAQMGAEPLLVLGRQLTEDAVQALRGGVPASARLFSMLDLATTLPHVSAAIHHGGAGTTHALVTYAVPQIVVPHAADQLRQAHGVARTAVGFHIAPRQVSVENLIQALARLLPDRSDYRHNAQSLRDEFALLGGVERAADLIEQIPV